MVAFLCPPGGWLTSSSSSSSSPSACWAAWGWPSAPAASSPCECPGGGPGAGCPPMGGRAVVLTPLSPQDAVLWAPHPRPQLGFHGPGHGGGGGEWGLYFWGGGQLRALPAPTVLRLVPPPQGTSDFCVAPDKFIMNQTESEISAGKDRPRGTPKHPWGLKGAVLCAEPPPHAAFNPLGGLTLLCCLICFAEVAHYYLYCEQSLSNPFQQVWGAQSPSGWGLAGRWALIIPLLSPPPPRRLSPSSSARSPPCRSRPRG